MANNIKIMHTFKQLRKLYKYLPKNIQNRTILDNNKINRNNINNKMLNIISSINKINRNDKVNKMNTLELGVKYFIP